MPIAKKDAKPWVQLRLWHSTNLGVGARGRECSNLWHGLKSFRDKRFCSEGWVCLAPFWKSQCEIIPAVIKFLSDDSRGSWWSRKSEKPKPSNEQSLAALFLSGEAETIAQTRSDWFESQPHPAPLNLLQNSHTSDAPLPPQHLLEPLNIIKTAMGSLETPDQVDFPER